MSNLNCENQFLKLSKTFGRMVVITVTVVTIASCATGSISNYPPPPAPVVEAAPAPVVVEVAPVTAPAPEPAPVPVLPQVIGKYPQPPPGTIQITVQYATDREFVSLDKGYSGQPSKTWPYLSYGTVLVSMPEKNRHPGEIPQPGWINFYNKNDSTKYMLIKKIIKVTGPVFFADLKKSLSNESQIKPAFIYIHGFNNSFKDAALRTAQIAVDLNIPTVPIFYSWPSRATKKGYPADEESSLWTQSHLLNFLSEFADNSSAADIYVIAHSMGNRPTTLALAALLEGRPELISRFKQVILAAPDINAAIFRDDIAPRFAKLKTPVTVYASGKDKALRGSYGIHGWARLGDVEGPITSIPGVDIIDASNITTNFMGHDYFASNRALLTDVALLFTTGLPARKRAGLKGIPSGQPEYWIFP